jgi:aspartyl/asparaginyl-tRNA synthetase
VGGRYTRAIEILAATAPHELVLGIGEIVGPSEPEARLEANLERHGLSKKEYAWYLDRHRYGIFGGSVESDFWR